MPKSASAETEFLERLRKTTISLGQLAHPNVLKVNGFEQIEDRLCLFLEPVKARNLNAYLLQANSQRQPTPPGVKAQDVTSKAGVQEFQKGLPHDEVKHIIHHAAEAVEEAHSLGIHHFNLGPANIFLTDDFEVKIAGFGIFETYSGDFFERIVSQAIAPIQAPEHATAVSTLDTLSPEFRKGEKPDARSDIYALGYCAFYLLTGQKPKAGITKPSELNPDIPREWDSIVEFCLEVNPDKRCPTAAALVSLMEEFDDVVDGKRKRRAVRKKLKPTLRPDSGTPQKTTKSQSPKLAGQILMTAVLVIIASIAAFTAKRALQPGDVLDIIRVPMSSNPRLSINIQPVGSTVSISTGGAEAKAFTARQGELGLLVPDGTYTITANAFLRQPETQTITLDKGESRKAQLEFDLKPDWSYLEITSTPGARIDALTREGPRFLGIVPESGSIRFENRLFEGAYDIRISKQNYVDQELRGVALLADDISHREAPLSLVPATLTINSNPQGIAITINGELAGLTPLENIEVTPGELLQVQINQEPYQNIKRVVQLEPGESATIDFDKLEVRKGKILFKLTSQDTSLTGKELALATATLNEKSYALDDDLLEDVPIGEYAISISHPNYKPWSGRVSVNEEQAEVIQAELAPLPGQLIIHHNPPVDLQVIANGEVQSMVNGRFFFEPRKPINLELHAKNFLIAKKEISLEPNEIISWNIDLVPIPGPSDGENYSIPYTGVDLVWVAPTTFTIGSPLSEQLRLPEEGPQTRVTLSYGFWIGEYEITQDLWTTIMGSNPSKFTGKRKPVDSVTWEMAMEFCERLTTIEHKHNRLPDGYAYRLPSEAEWELACRAGTETAFHFGDEADPGDGNFKGVYPRERLRTDEVPEDIYGTVEVGQYAPNAFNIFDMHGNVAEWCYDRFNSRYPGDPVYNWHGPDDGVNRVARGGGWEDFAHRCRSGARERRLPKIGSSSLGFRITLGPIFE